MENNTKTGKIKVSDLFIDIYKNFNVVSQSDRMKQLERRDLLLLLILSIDSYSDENIVVIENFRNYKNELDLIYDLQNDEDSNDEDLKFLSDVTDEKYIDTTRILDKDGESLPSPTTDDEAVILRREFGINQIVGED